MRPRNLLTFLLFVCVSSQARPPDVGPVKWLSLEEAETNTSAKPMLVYFGAEWCGPCKTLETTIFNQPEITQRLAAFRTVFIDGDGPDGMASMDRFKVKVFPSILSIDPGGGETGRLVGSAEKREFVQFLETATLAQGPDVMLALLESGAVLTDAQWKVLSQIDVDDRTSILDNDKAGKATLNAFRSRLAAAVAHLERRPRPLDSKTDAMIRVKSLIVDASSTQPGEAKAAHRALLDKVLGDSELFAEVESHVLGYSEDILAYLEPEPGKRKRDLANRLLGSIETAYSRPEASLPWKMELLELGVPLLEFGSDDATADRKRFADRAEAGFKDAADAKTRLAIIGSVAHVLRGCGREFRTEALVREALASAPDSYWLYASLARYARQRGDLEGAVILAERGYRLSLPRISPLPYGTSWVQALIDRAPDQGDAVAAAAEEVFRAASASADRFNGWHADAWSRFAGTLGTWAAADKAKRSSIIAEFERRFADLCAQVKEHETDARSCKAAANALTAPLAPAT